MKRSLLFCSAAAALTLAVSSPAAAQWFPPAYGYPGYGYGYGYHGYGYHGYSRVRGLQYRIDQLQYRIRQLDNRNIISEREARRLRAESRDLEYRLYRAARYGLHPAEQFGIERRIAALEYRIHYAASYRYGRGPRYGWYYGY